MRWRNDGESKVSPEKIYGDTITNKNNTSTETYIVYLN
jgi:hypothetical protein